MSDQPDLFAGRPATMESPPCAATYRGQRAHIRHATTLRADLGRAEHFEQIRKLEPLVLDVACRRTSFTMADVRDEAERIGWLTGEEGRPNPGTDKLEAPRALSYLGALLPGLQRIGLIAKVTDSVGRTVYERSDRPRAKHNKQALWRITERGEAARQVSGSSLAQLAEIIKAFRESGIRHGGAA